MKENRHHEVCYNMIINRLVQVYIGKRTWVLGGHGQNSFLKAQVSKWSLSHK